MRVISAYHMFTRMIDGTAILSRIAEIARVSHQSEGENDLESLKKFVSKIIALGHESVLEHESVSVRIVCDRGTSHQIVRHRLASYCQESTRACKYNELTFIAPCFWAGCSSKYHLWYKAMQQAEENYKYLITEGASPEEARSVLPNSLKTELVMTANLREWRLFFNLRAAGLYGKPHPQMLEITVPMLSDFKKQIPVVFDDIVVSPSSF